MRWMMSFLCCGLAVAANAAVNVERETARFRQAFPDVRFYHTGDRITTVYGPAFGFGESPERVASAFVDKYAGLLGADAGDLEPVSLLEDGRHTTGLMYRPDSDDYKFTLVYFTQHRGGVPVFRSDVRLLVRNEPGFPLVLVRNSLRELGDFAPDTAAPVRIDLAERAAHKQFSRMVNLADPELVIWAGYDGIDADTPRLAVRFIADDNQPATPDHEKWLFVADAHTGEILFSESQIHHVDVTGTTTGMATLGSRADACNAEAAAALPYATVQIVGGSSTFADINGDFVIPNGGAGAVTVRSHVSGRWFNVRDTSAGNSHETIDQNVTPPGPADFLHNPAGTQFLTAQVNAYIHANVVRDFALAANPAYPTISNQQSWPVYVNINSSCNAYYDGVSINFFRAAGGCNNTAFADVVHHEYGHHLVQVGGSGQGAYGEGMGDVMGVIILDQSQLGVGFSNCNSGIRNAANNCQFDEGSCSTCGSEIHACGQLISGCVWSTRNELVITEPDDYQQILRDLAVNAILVHLGSGITPQITIDWLTLDDDNANIDDGTPHYFEIDAGFGAHGMPGPLPLITVDLPDGLPPLVDPDGGTTVRVVANDVAGQAVAGSGRFYYNVGGGFVQGTMNEVEPNVYDAVFPAIACPQLVRYYFAVDALPGGTFTNPLDAPAESYTVASGRGFVTTFADDMEAGDNGWTVGAPGDDAATGIWNRMDPEQTPAQPGDDHSPGAGTQCWVTDGVAGTGPSSFDVDFGRTTLLTPMLDTNADTRISYWRWYSNDEGANPNTEVFLVEISNDAGNTWTNAETVGPDGVEASGEWFYHEFYVADVIAPTSQVMLRFIAIDEGSPPPFALGASLVEAAIDDFKVQTVTCAATNKADMNCDMVVDAEDIDPFFLAVGSPDIYVATYPDCDLANADVNDDGGVDAEDIDPFFACIGNGGCP